MSGDLIDLNANRETDRLRIALRRANERIEELEYDLKEARGENALAEAKAPLRVWFLKLTLKQAQLMDILCRAAPRTLSQSALLTALYPVEDQPAAKVLSVFLCKLRAKLAPVGLEISTDRGRGYFVSSTMAETWRRWCDATAAGEAPSDDFQIDPTALRAIRAEPAHQRFCDDVRTAMRAIKVGDRIDSIAGKIGRPASFVAAVDRGIASLEGRAPAAAPDATPLQPAGRDHEALVREASRRAMAELKVTSPQTIRRTAEITVDLMSEEILALAAEVS